jgi:hypothetical protein
MFDFLKTVTVVDTVTDKIRKVSSPRKERNPEGLTIRLFRDGSVYPSLELIEKFNLEYPVLEAGETPANCGNGFDVIDTDKFPAFQVGKRILIISPVNRKNGKIDLFGSTTYDENGVPKSKVAEQGAKTFGQDEFIGLVEDIYGITFAKAAVKAKEATETTKAVTAQPAVEGVEFVDLQFVVNPSTGQPWGLPTGKTVTWIPKKVSRGEKAGEYTIQRRELPVFYALLPKDIIPAEQSSAATDEIDNTGQDGGYEEESVVQQELAEA